MSLDLLQSYSSGSEEEEEEEEKGNTSDEEEEEEEENEDDNEERNRSRKHKKNNPYPPLPKSSPNSLLPSAFDAFAEVAGPPAFLNNSVAPTVPPPEVVGRRARNRSRRDKKDLPEGVVVEAKAQLVGIRDRVRSDVEGSSAPVNTNPTSAEGKRVISATNPEAKDAAELLRMCLQCGVPKTFSHARGMVCPFCGDRPQADPLKELDKKKGSTVKDKEKNKRMKGQSSHATWKSETEMHLRQQYD